jgi:GLPGLI family protein
MQKKNSEIKRKILLIFFLVVNSLYSQNISVHYGIKTKLEEKDFQDIDSYNDLLTSCENFVATLKCNNNNSVFKPNGENVDIYNYDFYCFNGSMYYKTNKEILYTNYLITRQIYSNWNYTDEYKEIAGFKCRKALLNEDVNSSNTTIAWIYEDEKLNYGPANYKAINGIILELEIKTNILTATYINFNYKNEFVLPKLEIIDIESYDKKIDEFFSKIKE